MSAARHIHQVLRGAPSITALVDNRIYYDEAPQEMPIPSIVLNSGNEFDRTMQSGPMNMPKARVNVICQSKTHTDADLLGEAVVDLLAGYQGQDDGKQITVFRDNVDGLEKVPAYDLHRRIVGFVVNYQR